MLLARGISVWSEHDADPGSSIEEATASAVIAAKAVIVIWGEGATKATLVNGVATLAVALGSYVGLAIGDQQRVPKPFVGQTHFVWTLRNGAELEGYILSDLTNRGVEQCTSASPHSDVRQGGQGNRGYAFISHVEEDGPVVSKFSGFLKTRGYAYWTYLESDRDYQKPTVLEIEERMNDCALVLTVISPDWKRSEWTQREFAFAREVRKPMFHLRFRNPGPTLAIAGDTYFDFERGEEDAFRKLGIELDKKGL